MHRAKSKRWWVENLQPRPQIPRSEPLSYLLSRFAANFSEVAPALISTDHDGLGRPPQPDLSDHDVMMFETAEQKRSIQRWSRLAIQLSGAAESGRFDDITTAVIATELEQDRVFEFLGRELPSTVWKIPT